MNNDIAMQAAPIDRNDRPTLRNTLLAVAASFVIAACSGGGADTVEKVEQVTHAGKGCQRCKALVQNVIDLGR